MADHIDELLAGMKIPGRDYELKIRRGSTDFYLTNYAPALHKVGVEKSAEGNTVLVFTPQPLDEIAMLKCLALYGGKARFGR